MRLLPTFERYHLRRDEFARALLENAQIVGNIEIHGGPRIERRRGTSATR
jgi:hypothetical protein